ncbi:NPC intracellular cholesterol transporter 2-like [Achroia grisella]|uniref:NPC intracellular cholesterol transporter 2-like n=1 Tax=Achroia grisella TaxID=688607 RepID=UPI0027D2D890|nr:NPC intracellular cholesterol transporter 2-like [Achroia grisella]
MVPFKQVVLLCSAILAVATATTVEQCPDKSIENLSENVHLSPCKKTPCLLRKGTNQHITVHFTPDKDISVVKNHVTAEVFGVPLPFVGVDGNSICDKITTEDGEKASCPLKAGTKYTYKDSFPVLSFYPTISVKVHWALMAGKSEFMCFEIPVKIV